MRLCAGLAVVAVMLAAPRPAAAQLPPGYWSYYDSGNKHYHRRAADYEMGRQRPAKKGSGALAVSNSRELSTVESSRPLFRSKPSSHQPFAAPLATDSADYAGRGLTGHGFSAYQGNGYQGSGQNLYYGYWDGGFNTGMYGFSMYPHFDRPGFTYWQ